MKLYWLSFAALIAACAPKPANPQGSSTTQTPPVSAVTDSLKPISEVLERHTSEWMNIPGVTGTGEGSNNGKPAILLFVDSLTDNLNSKLPKNVEGYSVVVKQSGSVQAR